jgi:hypothetical protein
MHRASAGSKMTTPRLACAFWAAWSSFGRQPIGLNHVSLGFQQRSLTLADSTICLCEEHRSGFNLFATSKRPHLTCSTPLGLNSARHRCLKLAYFIYSRATQHSCILKRKILGRFSIWKCLNVWIISHEHRLFQRLPQEHRLFQRLPQEQTKLIG